jgi:hypothetical protein
VLPARSKSFGNHSLPVALHALLSIFAAFAIATRTLFKGVMNGGFEYPQATLAIPLHCALLTDLRLAPSEFVALMTHGQWILHASDFNTRMRVRTFVDLAASLASLRGLPNDGKVLFAPGLSLNCGRIAVVTLSG